MKPNQMHQLAHNGTHECCPKDWRSVPNLTGDSDLDATIMHRSNTDLPDRLHLYTKHKSYAHKTAYNGYGKGDD